MSDQIDCTNATMNSRIGLMSREYVERVRYQFLSLRHLHDFLRQPTILDYDVRDSALLDLNACAPRNNGIDAQTIVVGPECNHAFSTARYF